MAARPEILLVESREQLGPAIAEQLRADGYRAELARTAEHARVLARLRPPRLIVLGSLEARRAPLALLEEIRASDGRPGWDRALPTIVIGAQADELEMVRAFEAGADDFLSPPARYLELRARLRAVLRRVERPTGSPPWIEVGGLAIDRRARHVALDGLEVDLRRLEFELLVHLAQDPERVFGKRELLSAVWGYECAGSTRTLDTHACRLRRKLERGDRARWVINVRGVGYRLT
jgi:DNA-binding response OmpR family regulator